MKTFLAEIRSAVLVTLALAVVVALVTRVASARGWRWRRAAPVAEAPEAPARRSTAVWIGVAVLAFTLIPLALRGVAYKPIGALAILQRNLLIYGLGGIIIPFLGIKLIDILITALKLV